VIGPRAGERLDGLSSVDTVRAAIRAARALSPRGDDARSEPFAEAA